MDRLDMRLAQVLTMGLCEVVTRNGFKLDDESAARIVAMGCTPWVIFN
jgi:hypothetical protein